MSDYFDLTRIRRLQEVMGIDAGSIVASTLQGMTTAIERVEAALAGSDLEAAIQPAHTARNDALMLGAGALQEALRDLEAAARSADEPRTAAALERLQSVWPPTRDELASIPRAE
jgi:HPt (histidine-containing phosphotransfer) domain-containing protein